MGHGPRDQHLGDSMPRSRSPSSHAPRNLSEKSTEHQVSQSVYVDPGFYPVGKVSSKELVERRTMIVTHEIGQLI